MRFMRHFVIGTQRDGCLVIGTRLLKIKLPSAIRILVNFRCVERPNLMVAERLEIGVLVAEQCDDFVSGFHGHKVVIGFPRLVAVLPHFRFCSAASGLANYIDN